METTIHWQQENKGEIRLLAEGQQIGKMDISRNNTHVTVYHTEVDPQYEGQGLAKKLLAQLVAFARENGLKIKPLCPYVHLQFKRHAEDYADVWEKNL